MSALQNLGRKAVLGLFQNPAVKHVAIRHGMKLGASRFIAGVDLDAALTTVKELNDQGLAATLDSLGEFVTDREQARAAADACIQVLDGIASQQLDCNLSLKLTQLGLDIDPALCKENMRAILTRAAQYDTFVRIDMEDSPRTDLTLALFSELASEFGAERVGTVIQSYLFRSEADLEALARLRANTRLVKGAYLEPPEVAFPQKADVDANYLKLVRSYLGAGCYTAIATHDESMINPTLQYLVSEKISTTQYEFQMLHGIRRDLQAQLVAAGHRVRVYVPFGTDWYGYFTRRLAERPANLFFVLSNMLKP